MDFRHTALWVCGALIAGVPATVSAGTPEERRGMESEAAPGTLTLGQRYTGVTPGKGNNLPRVEALKGKDGTWVTWPGFLLLEGGGSRLFLQTTEALEYRVKDDGLTVTLLLKQAKVYLTNNRNPLVTTHFNTPLKRAYLVTRKRETRLVLELKVKAVPEISRMTDTDGYHYMFVDFAPGNYPVEQTPQPGAAFSNVGDGTGSGRDDAESAPADRLPAEAVDP